MNKNYPKFSVLMSVYVKENSEFLRQSLDSILRDQTVLPDEVLLVEDGPLTEELHETISSYQTLYPNLKTLVLKENIGLGEALNAGLAVCSYDWIARMDTDDIAVSTRFEEQLNYILEHPEVDVLGGHISEFNEKIEDAQSMRKTPISHGAIRVISRRRNPMCHMTIFYRKQAVIKAGSYKHLPYVEDYYLWLRMMQKGSRFANLDKILVHARVGNGMIARRSKKEQITSWQVLNQFMLEHKMVSKKEQLLNMLYIRTFVYMPAGFKKWIYQGILRK